MFELRARGALPLPAGRYLRERELLPMVAFCFSKRKVDASADCLTGLDLTSSAEKAEIHRFAERALGRLGESDRRVPQARPRAHRPCLPAGGGGELGLRTPWDLGGARPEGVIPRCWCYDPGSAERGGTGRQVLRVRELLSRGLGVHHAGLLPIVKELVELLFCRGVIKAREFRLYRN